MNSSYLKETGFVDKYGTEATHSLLLDLLVDAKTEGARQQIEEAIEELDILIQTDEKGLFVANKEYVEQEVEITSIPPAYTKNCVEIWLFDDAIISCNTLANHFHGYRSYDGQTMPITPDELKYYKDIIANPRKLLNL